MKRKPQKGDIWEFRRKGRKVRKQVGDVYLKWRYEYKEYTGQQLRSWRELYVSWYRLPKGRYSGAWVKWLLANGTLISTKAERDKRDKARWRAIGCQP